MKQKWGDIITEALRNQLKGIRLTKKEKIIAEFILDNFAEACFITSTDIANRLNVSDSSVIRFTRTLGYTGFMDFQKSIRKAYTEHINSVSSSITIPAERLKKSIEQLDKGSVIESYFSNTLKNLEKTITNNSTADFERASDLIISSKTKYIVSSRANSGTGDMLFLLLKLIVPNVYSTSFSALNVIDHLSDIGENDCLIVISFPRYSQMDILATQLAHDTHAKIILITDKVSAPLSQYADLLFIVDVDSNAFFNSYVAVTFLIETLCSFVSKKIGYSNEEKLKLIDKYIAKLGLF